MKSLALISLASGAMAGVLLQRDIATIQAAMTAAGNGIVSLDTAVKAYTGGDASSVSSAADALVQTLKNGKAQVDPTGDLSLSDALGLQAPSQALQAQGDALLADLKAKKTVIAANGLCETTFNQASAINTASQALINSVVSKVPAAAQGIAQGIVAGLLKDLQDSQDAFSPANCKDTGSPPTSSTAAPPATTTAAPPATSTAPPPVTTTAAPPATTTNAPPPLTTTAAPASDTCPAASTVTVTTVDSADCTAIPTCTKKPVVTVTSTKKSCPTGSRLPW